MAVYPLNRNTQAKDISFSRNPHGILGRVRYAPGPDNSNGGSIEFYGRSSSYIQFPNRGKIDTRQSITLLAWIYHTGRAGPIFNYMPNGWGVHLWMVSPRTLFARFTRRKRRRFTAAVYSRSVLPRKWQFVGATYSYRTGVVRLFLNSKFVASKRIGRFRLATNYPVRMGARIGDRRYFKGRISCMQVYNQALNRNQILVRQKRCFRPGNISGTSDHGWFVIVPFVLLFCWKVYCYVCLRHATHVRATEKWVYIPLNSSAISFHWVVFLLLLAETNIRQNVLE